MYQPIEDIKWCTLSTPKMQSRKIGYNMQQIRNDCWKVLRHAWKTFAFDKICYWICPSKSSKHMALNHACGNCYSFSIYVQHLLKTNFGIDSHIIVGAVPTYYMRPIYKGICHAAVYVPGGEIILDPSVYSPPIPVTFDASSPESRAYSLPNSILYKHADSISARAYFHTKPFRVVNQTNTHMKTFVPANTFEIKVSLHKKGWPLSQYSYVLRGVQNFDQSITNHVHTVNQSLFRQQTNSKGQFTHSVRLYPETNVVVFENKVSNKRTVMKVDDKNWRLRYKWTPEELHFFQSSNYCSKKHTNKNTKQNKTKQNKTKQQ